MNKNHKAMDLLKKAVLFLIILSLLLQMGITRENRKNIFWTKMREELKQKADRYVLLTHLPVFVYVEEDKPGSFPENIILYSNPFLQIIREEQQIFVATESSHEIDRILLQEGSDEENREHKDLSLEQDAKGVIRVSPDMEDMVAKENEGIKQEKQKAAKEENVAGQNPGIGNRIKKQEFDWDYYAVGENLMEDFYAIDSSTQVRGDRLRLEKLLTPDLSLGQDNSKPQILVYHTHSQEGFADSVAGDPATTIVGAGSYLCELLQQRYGYQVIHHTGEYDLETRDYAYSYALPNIEKLLKEHPSIEVVIDLHRDAAAKGTRLVTEIDGKKTARFMFFNGLSYTNKQGEIDYLKNPYIQENLAFSFQMQVLCNEYYPDVARRIYLKGYRYNMHVRPKTLLVEMGAQTNTREEIWNGVEILADVLDMQLSGVDR